jgi:hypothetical protein
MTEAAVGEMDDPEIRIGSVGLMASRATIQQVWPIGRADVSPFALVRTKEFWAVEFFTRTEVSVLMGADSKSSR